jgi:hypothetical protein
MRTLFGLFGSLLLLTCLAMPAEADGMRPLNGSRSPFMFAPTPSHLRFSGPMIGHDHPFRGQAFTRPFTMVNPGPVPPFAGTIVPPFSVGGTVHPNIAMFPGHDQRDRFHRFHRGFPAEPFFLPGETDFPDQVEMPGDTGEEARTPDVEATSPSAPDQSVAGPAAPTWRSGRSVLTGTLEEPHIILVGPARESREVRIFTPSSEQQGKSGAPAPQIVEVPAQ